MNTLSGTVAPPGSQGVIEEVPEEEVMVVDWVREADPGQPPAAEWSLWSANAAPSIAIRPQYVGEPDHQARPPIRLPIRRVIVQEEGRMAGSTPGTGQALPKTSKIDSQNQKARVSSPVRQMSEMNLHLATSDVKAVSA